jgi:hypothetical protein
VPHQRAAETLPLIGVDHRERDLGLSFICSPRQDA